MSEFMRVMLFNDSKVFAGTERHIFDLACALHDQNVNVCVGLPVDSPLTERLSPRGIRTVEIPRRGPVDWRAARILCRLLVERQVDLIHTHNGRTHIAAALAVARAGRGACVTTQHFIEPNRTNRRGLGAVVARMLHGYAARHTDHYIAISQAVREGILRREEARPDLITVVPNGVPITDDERANPGTELRRELGISADAPVVVCAARLEEEKDLPTLIRGMKRVIEACPAARCLIAGEGSLRAALQALIDQSGLSKSVTLLGFRTDVRDVMRACDIFALPSVAEPFGLVIIEAMALAKPVVACRAGGPVEIIGDSESGLLVDPRSPEAFAHAILQLLDAAKRRAMGDAALARVRQEFDIVRTAQRTLAVYRRALSPRDTPRVTDASHLSSARIPD